jgi:hypothetical protein
VQTALELAPVRSLWMLALYLGLLDADFTIVDSPELVDALRKLTGRFQRAIVTSQRASG